MTYNDCLANVISNIEYAYKHMTDYMFDEFVSDVLNEISNYTEIHVGVDEEYEDEDGTSL